MIDKDSDTLRLGSTRRLLIDDWVIRSKRNVSRQLHAVSKHLDNPIFCPSRPWEGTAVLLQGAVIRDEQDGIYKMWYQTGNKDTNNFRDFRIFCYAESVDGLCWQRPELGLHDFYGQTTNNIVYVSHNDGVNYGRFLGATLIKDRQDHDPARRYKMMNWQYSYTDKYASDILYPSGVYSACSPDGLRWNKVSEPVFRFSDSIGDTLNLMCDTKRNCYVAFVKIFLDPRTNRRLEFYDGGRAWRDEAGKLHPLDPKTDNPKLRQRAISVSDDFINWTTPELMFPIDEKDGAGDEHYNNTGFVYEDQYIGLLSIYHKLSGCFDTQLINSHDGLHWERAADRGNFIPAGRYYCDWDFGTSAIAGTPPLLVGDELWFYYSARWAMHGSGPPYPVPQGEAGSAIGLATLRRDGFVSLDANGDEGMIETKPMVLEGEVLRVNANCGRGSLLVELIDEGAASLPALGKEICMPIASDNTRHLVQWRGVPSLRDYAKRRVRFRFYLQNASLYSFWCDTESARF